LSFAFSQYLLRNVNNAVNVKL